MIYAYHRPCGASRFAQELCLSIAYPRLGAQVVRKRVDRQPNINWGLTTWGYDVKALPKDMLNRSIQAAVSKVKTFECLAAAKLPVPRYAKTLEELRKMLPASRAIIARRDGLSGGKGMELVQGLGEVSTLILRPDFYVERLSCHREFRVHVFLGQVIHKQAKFIPKGFDGIAKNWENGCYFTSEGLERFATEAQLRDLEQLSVRSVEALGLQFGAVDILLTRKLQPYVLEVNTAPGLRSDATYNAYTEAVKKLYAL